MQIWRSQFWLVFVDALRSMPKSRTNPQAHAACFKNNHAILIAVNHHSNHLWSSISQCHEYKSSESE